MVNRSWLTRVLLGTAVVVALALAVGALLPQAASAHGGRGGMFGGGWGHGGGWGMMRPGGDVDRDALLAEALGISAEDLQTARAKAAENGIRRAVEKKTITQEQADLMLAQLKVRSYLDQDALMAEALGMTAEELQAASDAGKTSRDLLEEQDLDRSTLRDKLTAARDKAIDQAVKDGAITAAQAETLKASDQGGCGMMGPGGMTGGGPRHGSMRRHGTPGSDTPDTVTPGSDTSGTGPGGWGRGSSGNARLRVRSVPSDNA